MPAEFGDLFTTLFALRPSSAAEDGTVKFTSANDPHEDRIVVTFPEKLA
jgi:hypothetical protein